MLVITPGSHANGCHRRGFSPSRNAVQQVNSYYTGELNMTGFPTNRTQLSLNSPPPSHSFLRNLDLASVSVADKYGSICEPNGISGYIFHSFVKSIIFDTKTISPNWRIQQAKKTLLLSVSSISQCSLCNITSLL